MTSTDSPRAASRPGKASVVIAVILSIVALHLGREFFIPIAMALLFHALLRRPVRLLEAWHVPTALGSFLVLVAGIAILVTAGWSLADPVQAWFAKAPSSIAAAQAKVRAIRRPLERPAQAAARPAPAAAAAAQPSMVTQALNLTTQVLVALTEMVLLLYLLLSSGDLFLQKLLRVLPAREDKRAAIDVLHFAESVVARYLVFTVLIAAVQGVAVGLVMWALGMPDPLAWAVLTLALELIPYLGAVVMVAMLTVTALATFGDLGHAVLVPLSYLAISAVQNNVVTPVVFSGRLRLNSVAVLIGVVFWWFLWGVPGAFLAIPIMAMLKALSDEIPRLKTLGEFLGD